LILRLILAHETRESRQYKSKLACLFREQVMAQKALGSPNDWDDLTGDPRFEKGPVRPIDRGKRIG
jgi:hypothetical protein